MEVWLSVMERFVLALVLGGGVIMSAGVRPFLLRAVRAGAERSVVALVDVIRIQSWGRYDRLAFVSAIVLLVAQGVRIMGTGVVSYAQMVLTALLLFSAACKLLYNRLHQSRLPQIGSGQGPDGSVILPHEAMALARLTVSILILSVLLLVLAVQ